LERQLEHYQQGVRGAHEEDTYGRQMAPMAAILGSGEAVVDVSAWLASLPATQPETTVSGDPGRGAAHYNSCSACHGSRAQGNEALQAPRLTGLQDWYIRQQLENFRRGVRGSHSEDRYGKQMVLMARSVQNEQSIDDLLSYLNTL
ncbi:MAG: cytochrome c, partial [Haliea sp.]|nr:cytochrome c [Haliea sp.]